MGNLERLTETELAEYIVANISYVRADGKHIVAKPDPRNPGDAIATVTRPNGIEDTYRIRVFAL